MLKSNHNRLVALSAFLFVASVTMLFGLEACGQQESDLKIVDLEGDQVVRIDAGGAVFWAVREAFLPPVTIEELDALAGTPKAASSELTPKDASGNSPVERLAGTRGWYDNASEAVNFIVPASVALTFVAIEMIVLMAVSLQ